jgi:hypothetical protein
MEDLFSSKDFEGLLYNITLVSPNKKVVVAFPKLASLPSFRHTFRKIDKEKIIRYIILMYDKDTPFRKRYNKVNQRKIEVARYVGFEHEDGGLFSDDVNDMLMGNNNDVNRMVVEYVRHQKNYKYTYLVGLEEGFHTILQEVTNGKISNLSKLEDMQNQLEQTMTDLLNDDKSIGLREDLMEYMEEERLELRPEDIAEKILNGESPIKSEEIS